MKVAVLFSGGKDSCYAAYLAQEAGHEITCLISMISENPESYMFHMPNIELTGLQAEAMDIPLLQVSTEGRKEEELNDLANAIAQAKEDVGIEAVVTGAVASIYQASRIQEICDQLGLWCLNPLWQMDQLDLLRNLKDFRVMITGVFGYPLDRSWLGRIIDAEAITELAKLEEKFRINPAGEGGEIETTVLGGPLFKRSIVVRQSEIEMQTENAGVYIIEEAELE